MTNHTCPTCQRPIELSTAVHLGDVVRVRYCSTDCVEAWISGHDRRHHDVWVPFERRAS